MKKIFYIFSVITFLSLASCSPVAPNNDPIVEDIKVESVSFDKATISLEVGKGYQLTYKVLPETATNKNVTFSSSQTSVATVTDGGYVTGQSEGDAVITISTIDGNKTATCQISVFDNSEEEVPVESIAFNKNELKLKEGDSARLSVIISPSNATNRDYELDSDNKNVATIDDNGNVTAKKEGTTTLRVTSLDAGLQGTCRVTVSKDVVDPSDPDDPVDPDPDDPVDPVDPVDPDPEEVDPQTRMQDRAILHCWDWSMTNITNSLQDIKNAGFTAIQLSPMQPQKDYYPNDPWQKQWWKLYQPLGFSIATKDNCLGVKSELITLCQKAEEAGIDVIMDVVSNHLAGGGRTYFHSDVGGYEPDIYNNNLYHTPVMDLDDENIQAVVQGQMGDFPDLKTETTTVQNRVISLLKEYIDCGVDGFRFDAAKHIETPDDGDYASNYWPNVLNTTTQYAKSQNKNEPYYYGEILNTCGVGRSFSSYTKYMSVVDSNQGHDLLEAIKAGTVSNISTTYNTGVNPDHLVLWAESHDTYANDWKETTDVPISDIHKAYMIQASRKSASTLYFARPDVNASNAKVGDIGDLSYKNKEIKAINEFHDLFYYANEDISTQQGCYINVRGKLGAAIVGVSNSSNNITLEEINLDNGNYKDLVTGNTYIVNNNSVTINLVNNACILVNTDTDKSLTPNLSVSSYKQIYSTTQNVQFSVKNATETAYSINNGDYQTVLGSSISLPSSIANGVVNLTIKATNQYGSVYKHITLLKTSTLADKDVIFYNVNDEDHSILCWAWQGSNDGKFYDLSKDGNMLGLELGNNDSFLLVKFPAGTTSSNANWDNKISQTGNMSINNRVYNFAELTFE